MVVFPGAKINLGLEVLAKRPDGFHEIRSVLYPIRLHDALEVIADPALATGELIISHSGIPVPGDPANDLCARAVRAFAGSTVLPGLRVHLHKAVPIGAGLGGGSSDAAWMLRVLHRMFPGTHTAAELPVLAATLGSDVPFFLMDGPCSATGRGEVLHPIPAELAGKWLLLANPGIHVPTPEVYRGTVPEASDVDLAQAMALGQWSAIRNRMETYVFKTYPAVEELLNRIRVAGPFYSAMSGSGSSVFGLFHHRPAPLHQAEGIHQWVLQL